MGQPFCRTVDVLKCKKSAVTVLYVYGLMLAFYLPFISVVMVVMSEAILGVTQSVTLAYDVATAIVFINSSLNPIIYCWRMAQIRLAVINILENFMFCKNLCRLSSPLAARDVQLNQGITERGATAVITGYVYLEEHSSAEGGRP